jgi:hypothetical protein
VNHLRKVIYLCGLTVLVALLSTELASAGTITVFSNLGGGFEGGGVVIGQEPPGGGGGNEVIGQSFVPSTTVDFADTILALQNVFGSAPLAVHLESDNSGVPGTILDTPTQVGTISMSPGEVTFTCTTCPLIDAGSTYWLVASSIIGTAYEWNTATAGGLGTFAVNHSGSPTGPWALSNIELPLSAFQVDGTTVPEPGTMLLLSTALAGFAGIRRVHFARAHIRKSYKRH